MLALIGKLRALEARARDKSAQAKPLFDKRGQLLPRERVARLLDIGAPWLELSSIAGYGLDTPDLEKSVPGGGMIAGIGYVSGVRCMVVASDSGIDAGAIQHMGREKLLRAQELVAEEQAAVRAPGRVRGREPAALSRRGLHPRRRDLPQSGEALRRGHSGDHRRARLVHRGRRLHAGPFRLRDHGARTRQGLPRRVRRC